MNNYLNPSRKLQVEEIIRLALLEDVGEGDHSSASSIPEDAQGSMRLIVKDSGILAGMGFAQLVVDREEHLEIKPLLEDGASVVFGDIAFTLHGTVRDMLRVERLILNIMQRMSAIATKVYAITHQIADAGLHTKILDTRKTTPNLRVLEKWAVVIGGGVNHRFGLYDMIMLKDNHIDFAGGLKEAVQNANRYKRLHGLDVPIVVEVRDKKELEEVLQCNGVYRILLDNFSPKQTQEAVERVQGKVLLESSGGITSENFLSYAQTGVDYISMGALTHSYKSLDMSLKAM